MIYFEAEVLNFQFFKFSTLLTWIFWDNQSEPGSHKSKFDRFAKSSDQLKSSTLEHVEHNRSFGMCFRTLHGVVNVSRTQYTTPKVVLLRTIHHWYRNIKSWCGIIWESWLRISLKTTVLHGLLMIIHGSIKSQSCEMSREMVLKAQNACSMPQKIPRSHESSGPRILSSVGGGEWICSLSEFDGSKTDYPAELVSLEFSFNGEGNNWKQLKIRLGGLVR